MAELGVVSGISEKGKVGIGAGEELDKHFDSGEVEEAKDKAFGGAEKAEKQDGAQRDGKKLKPEAETTQEGETERDRKEKDGEVQGEEGGKKLEKDEFENKKPGRKPKGIKAAAKPETGSKHARAPERPEGKRKKRKSSAGEPLTPNDRPFRARKSIDRFVASIEKDKAREVRILKGSGTPLKDIPNVAYNLSKRSRADTVLSSLHSLLYGGYRLKGTFIKNNILQFSGYVWGENEEKDKAKVKEKLDRFTKEALLMFASILDIPVSKTGIKKEDLILKVMEFLESPQQTTDELLEEKEQELKGKKRKSLTPGKPGRGRPSKNQKTGDTLAKRGRKKQPPLEEATDDELFEEKEETDVKTSRRSISEHDEFEGKRTPVKNITKDKASSVANKQKPSEKKAKKKNLKTTQQKSLEARNNRKNLKITVKSPSLPKVDVLKESTKSSSKALFRKDTPEKEAKKNVKTEGKGKGGKESKAAAKLWLKPNTSGKSTSSAGEKKAIKETSNQTGRGVAKGKESAKPEKRPSAYPTDEQLKAEICELLQDADFSMVTFTDVVKQLEGKFNVSLLERKAHVKVLIREELSKIVEEGEDGKV